MNYNLWSWSLFSFYLKKTWCEDWKALQASHESALDTAADEEEELAPAFLAPIFPAPPRGDGGNLEESPDPDDECVSKDNGGRSSLNQGCDSGSTDEP